MRKGERLGDWKKERGEEGRRFDCLLKVKELKREEGEEDREAGEKGRKNRGGVCKEQDKKVERSEEKDSRRKGSGEREDQGKRAGKQARGPPWIPWEIVRGWKRREGRRGDS